MQIAIEYIKWLQEERIRINTACLDDITFFEDGKVVEISPEALRNHELTGLNHIDFITTGEYLT